MSDLKIAILGAGVVGINTALYIAQNMSKCQIDIVADKFLEDTTSYGPAGIFRPSPSLRGPSYEITRKWIISSYNYYRELLDYPEAGVSEVSGYIFSNISEDIIRNRYIEKLLPVYRTVTDEEKLLNGSYWKYGSYFETVMSQCSYFLPWSQNKLKGLGVRFVKENVSNFTDLETRYNVVFNCTGLGAKYLCNDFDVVPIRGQLAYVEAPCIHRCYYNDYDTYIIPLGQGMVALGGCRNYGSYDISINKYDTASIKERCEALQPCLQTAKIVKQWTGLRPHRSSVRVELENLKKLKVIHNYGHGGYGITTAPGTAEYAANLFHQSHMQTSLRSRI